MLEGFCWLNLVKDVWFLIFLFCFNKLVFILFMVCISLYEVVMFLVVFYLVFFVLLCISEFIFISNDVLVLLFYDVIINEIYIGLYIKGLKID